MHLMNPTLYVADSGRLDQIASWSFVPLQYFSVGHTFQIVSGKVEKEETAYYKPHWLKTIFAIIGLLPFTIIGLSFRFAALQYEEVEARYSIASRYENSKYSLLEEKIKALSSQLLEKEKEKAKEVEERKKIEQQLAEKASQLRLTEEKINQLNQLVSNLNAELDNSKSSYTYLQSENQKLKETIEIQKEQHEVDEEEIVEEEEEIEEGQSEEIEELDETDDGEPEPVENMKTEATRIPTDSLFIPRYQDVFIRCYSLGSDFYDEKNMNAIQAMENLFPGVHFFKKNKQESIEFKKNGSELCILLVPDFLSRVETGKLINLTKEALENQIPVLLVYALNKNENLQQLESNFNDIKEEVKRQNYADFNFTTINLEDQNSFSLPPPIEDLLSLRNWFLKKKTP